MNRVVRFLMLDGQFLQVLMPVQTANRIVRDWKAGTWKNDHKEFISSDEYPPGDLPWAIKVDSIVCIHVCALDPVQQSPVNGPTPDWVGRSGRT